jgi:hypothetical protein
MVFLRWIAGTLSAYRTAYMTELILKQVPRSLRMTKRTLTTFNKSSISHHQISHHNSWFLHPIIYRGIKLSLSLKRRRPSMIGDLYHTTREWAQIYLRAPFNRTDPQESVFLRKMRLCREVHRGISRSLNSLIRTSMWNRGRNPCQTLIRAQSLEFSISNKISINHHKRVRPSYLIETPLATSHRTTCRFKENLNLWNRDR